MYAGVEPAGLFRSADRGATWSHVEGLTNHPSRPEWQPGNGGLILHSIVPSDEDPNRVWVGIRSVGAFETDDGGKSWATRNKGVRAGFMPEGQQYPDFGQCVHKLVIAADGGEHLYQQNHCGVYRSTDGGKQWEEITPGLPTEFGFPMAAHPRDPKAESAASSNARRVRSRFVRAARARGSSIGGTAAVDIEQRVTVS
jgi:photosystem II stability/assembly factor-like uncharacterized protein